MTNPGHRRIDQYDVPLIDAVLLEEIHLLTALMVAAFEAEDHLDEAAARSTASWG